MKVSLRPRSPFRVSLPISRMFIAVYVVFTLGVADGGRDPVGNADGVLVDAVDRVVDPDAEVGDGGCDDREEDRDRDQDDPAPPDASRLPSTRRSGRRGRGVSDHGAVRRILWLAVRHSPSPHPSPRVSTRRMSPLGSTLALNVGKGEGPRMAPGNCRRPLVECRSVEQVRVQRRREVTLTPRRNDHDDDLAVVGRVGSQLCPRRGVLRPMRCPRAGPPPWRHGGPRRARRRRSP